MMHQPKPQPVAARTSDPVLLAHVWLRKLLASPTVTWDMAQRNAAGNAIEAAEAKHTETLKALEASLPLLTRMLNGQPYSRDVARRARDKVLAALTPQMPDDGPQARP